MLRCLCNSSIGASTSSGTKGGGFGEFLAFLDDERFAAGAAGSVASIAGADAIGASGAGAAGAAGAEVAGCTGETVAAPESGVDGSLSKPVELLEDSGEPLWRVDTSEFPLGEGHGFSTHGTATSSCSSSLALGRC